MSMGTSIYSLPNGMRMGQKLNIYTLDLGMAMRINFFSTIEYGIAKPIPVLPRWHL